MRLSRASAIGTQRHDRGFSLIELMIAVAVVAILAAVALPSFLDSIRKGRRSEAFTALAALQQAQERWRSTRPTYTSTLSDLTGISATTRPGGYYAISLESGATGSSYIASADGSGSGQANDGQCAKLSVKVEAGAITYGSCATCTSFTYTDSNACWKR